MIKTPIKLLRYNTGNDKKAFVKFKNNFDAVIFNATIVAYSGSSIADLVSVHKSQYIIDPQTYIFQHSISAIQNKEKTGIKKSVQKYLDELPDGLCNILKSNNLISFEDIENMLDDLVGSIYNFQKNYVNKFLSDKEYDKYLKFAGISGPSPKFIISPYFMLKKDYCDSDICAWMKLNKESFIKTKSISIDDEVATQIVIEKELLLSKCFFDEIHKMFKDLSGTYTFLWIDDFDSFEAGTDYQDGYLKLLKLFSELNVYPIMAYGGYDSIFMCHKNIKYRLYGVAQSVGYGEKRQITPVGGGLPVNKYYFLPLHRRLKFGDAAQILQNNGYFDSNISNKQHSLDYYKDICNCKQCKEVIIDDIDNFDIYNESIPFSMKGKNGLVSRNRPTTYASYISAIHFLHSKVTEWNIIQNCDKTELRKQIIDAYKKYLPSQSALIITWCNKYVN